MRAHLLLMTHPLHRVVLLCVLCGGFMPLEPLFARTSGPPTPAHGQAGRQPAGAAAVTGRVTATGDRIPLPGITVILRRPDGVDAAIAMSGPDGRFRIAGIARGRYELAVLADGFRPFERPVDLSGGGSVDVDCALELAAVVETVNVVRPSEADAGFGLTASIGAHTTVDGATLSSSPLLDGDVAAALRAMPGVVQRGTALSIRGGRANQSRMDIDGSDVSDPATGETWYRLPGDAVAVVDVLAGPAAVEFGRFASGLTALQTKRGGREWSASVNNLEPGLITKRRRPLVVIGLESVSPRFTVGGPLVPDRVYLTESAQLRYMSSEIQSRPQDERRVNFNVSSFTRADATLSTRQSLAGTMGVYYKRLSAANIDTFTPPDASADLRYRAVYGAARETVQLSGSALVEALARWGVTSASTTPRGRGEYVLAPDWRAGGFFNTQDRRTRTGQAAATLTWSRQGPYGSHLFKAGADVVWTDLDWSSASGLVVLAAADGRALSQIRFGPSLPGRVATWDAAAFVQDRWQVHSRAVVEGGARLDRDGVLGVTTVSPRLGAVLALGADRQTTVRTGFGLFRERTPSAVATFARLESRTQTLSLPSAAGAFAEERVTWAPQTGTMDAVPRSVSWDIGVNHRVGQGLTVGGHVLLRRGDHDLVVNPTGTGPDRLMALDTRGQSSYRDGEVTVRWVPGPAFDVAASYTRSSSWADLNAFSLIFGDLRSAVVRPNVYARSDYDVPHRALARVRASVGPKWEVAAALDWKSGFPWAAVDEALQYVGTPNEGRRFPSAAIVDLSIERRVGISKLRGWLGVSVFNAFNTFAPVDVQRNTASPRFGYFFNADRRSIRVGFRMH